MTVHQQERAKTLIEATIHILKNCDDSLYIKNVMEETAIWDGVECDGNCLKEELEELFIEIMSDRAENPYKGNMQELQALAKDNADINEDRESEQWHSSYYGFIFGFQKCEELSSLKLKLLSSDIGKALSKIGDLERELKALKLENSVLKKLVR